MQQPLPAFACLVSLSPLTYRLEKKSHQRMPKAATEVILTDRFLKISMYFHVMYLKNEVGDPSCFCISGTSNSLAERSRSFIKLSMLEDFHVSILNSCELEKYPNSYLHSKQESQNNSTQREAVM